MNAWDWIFGGLAIGVCIAAYTYIGKKVAQGEKRDSED